MPAYRTIVVGTDGSATSFNAVDRAAAVAADTDADLVIVCAYSELTGRQEARAMANVGEPPVGQVPGRSAASVAIADAVAAAQEQGATISAALLVHGEPATALLTTAKERAADLIVVGALRDTSIADRLLGTVATEVVRRAESEVLVVRPRLPLDQPGEPESG